MAGDTPKGNTNEEPNTIAKHKTLFYVLGGVLILLTILFIAYLLGIIPGFGGGSSSSTASGGATLMESGEHHQKLQGGETESKVNLVDPNAQSKFPTSTFLPH